VAAAGENLEVPVHDPDARIEAANREAVQRLFDGQPRLVDVRPAIDVLPGMTRETVLTSGPPLPWSEYIGGQRQAILGGAVYEGLAPDLEAAEKALDSGDIRVAGCHDFATVGSLAGVTTASMPVLVVEDENSGHRGHCTLFEGETKARLNYGLYDQDVQHNLEVLADVIGPTLGEVVRSVEGGIPLRPLIERALRQGDELHSRNTAASLLFLREIVPALLDLESPHARVLTEYMTSGDYFFLRLSMAASKSMADRAYDVPGSSVVTAMAFSCREFGIRVSGLGSQWFRGPLPTPETHLLFPGFTADDIEVMGGESPITEVNGLGGLAQAAAFPLQAYQGGTPQRMVERNLEMYEITVAEHPTFRIPFLEYRGTPAGIDARRVATTGTTPVMDVGIAGRAGGQIGAGCFRAPLEPFVDAATALGSQLAEDAVPA
jgi:hypothetical protein